MPLLLKLKCVKNTYVSDNLLYNCDAVSTVTYTHIDNVVCPCDDRHDIDCVCVCVCVCVCL